MPIMVVIHFPIDFDEVERRTGGKIDWGPVVDAWERAGARHYHQITRDGEFIDLDEFPSEAAYARFKEEAGPTIEKFEALLGVRSTDVVWDVADRRGA
ncbi:hypothetical protein [Pseudonocardia acaciae]|uniref:hypothetical protein n=1 Tax=Pseudonocardia acaciae TaxID=551276 RepID=UPI00048ACD27|nr:hypothetical protein [Pseudonocardia acaciae]